MRRLLAALRDIILRNSDISVLPENIYFSNRTQPWPLSTDDTSSSAVSEILTPRSPEDSRDHLTGMATEELVPSVYTLQWQLERVGTTDYMRFTLICAATGWVGLGFAKGRGP